MDKSGWFGLIAVVPGVFFVLLGIFSSDDSSMPSGRGPVIAAGFVFVFAGIACIVGALRTRAKGVIGSICGTLLLASMTAVPAFIFVDEGECVVLVLSLIPCAALTLAGVGWTVKEIRKLNRPA